MEKVGLYHRNRGETVEPPEIVWDPDRRIGKYRPMDSERPISETTEPVLVSARYPANTYQ